MDKTDPPCVSTPPIHQRSTRYLSENMLKKEWSLLRGVGTRGHTGGDMRGCKGGDTRGGVPAGWLQLMEESLLDQRKRVRNKEREKKRKPLWADPNLFCLPAPHRWDWASHAAKTRGAGEKRCLECSWERQRRRKGVFPKDLSSCLSYLFLNTQISN